MDPSSLTKFPSLSITSMQKKPASGISFYLQLLWPSTTKDGCAHSNRSLVTFHTFPRRYILLNHREEQLPHVEPVLSIPMFTCRYWQDHLHQRSPYSTSIDITVVVRPRYLHLSSYDVSILTVSIYSIKSDDKPPEGSSTSRSHTVTLLFILKLRRNIKHVSNVVRVRSPPIALEVCDATHLLHRFNFLPDSPMPYVCVPGKPLLARHRMVNAALKEELVEDIHALSMTTKTPAQWEADGGKTVLPSPPCAGGHSR